MYKQQSDTETATAAASEQRCLCHRYFRCAADDAAIVVVVVVGLVVVAAADCGGVEVAGGRDGEAEWRW